MPQYAFYKFKFGYLKIGYKNNSVILLKKTDFIEDENNPSELTNNAAKQMDEYFSGKRKEFDFPIIYEGTEFQKKVWSALREIPYGETRTYKQLAEAVGNPKACRAVGGANNKNPIWIAVPCHRVIGADGSLVGYEGGIDMKRYLLELEQKFGKNR